MQFGQCQPIHQVATSKNISSQDIQAVEDFMWGEAMPGVELKTIK